jgi:hypothetical protein
MSEPRQYMTVAEFRRLGYLQELNRLFLHPLGLALEVVLDGDGAARFGSIWDARNDPEGICYGEPMDRAKAEHVYAEQQTRWGPRRDGLGYFIQPIGETRT